MDKLDSTRCSPFGIERINNQLHNIAYRLLEFITRGTQFLEDGFLFQSELVVFEIPILIKVVQLKSWKGN
jgi:hypothetical protein